jgi:TetR/AcrR family transcriptional regulator
VTSRGKQLAVAARSGAPTDPRERILAAAFRVVARDTISGTRMPAIAREAGLSQGALHYYWDSKDNLLLNLLDWLLSAFREGRGIMSGASVPPAPAHDVAAGRTRQLALVRLLITREPEMTRVYYDFWVQAASRSGPLQESMRQELRRYRNELKRTMLPESHPGYDDDVLAGFLLGILEGPLLQLELDEHAFDREGYLQLADRVMVDILGEAPAGLPS